MHYKTIILGLIEQRTTLHEQLRKEEALLSAIDRYATELKTRHEAWKETLSRSNPGSEQQIASEAMELAIREIELSLPDESQPDDSDGPTLDGAMAFIKRHTPPA
jgi:hypothetical protein